MTGFKALEALSLLARSTDAVSRLSLETPYGLVVEVGADGHSHVRLTESPGNNAAEPLPPASQPGYRYHVELDYKTNNLWYSDWTPERDGPNVDDEDLRERYAASWCDAYDSWVDKYTRAFEANECHLASGGDPFPDVADRVAFQVEGFLLAVWLALQPGVESVGFPDYLARKQYRIEEAGVSQTVTTFLEDLKEAK